MTTKTLLQQIEKINNTIDNIKTRCNDNSICFDLTSIQDTLFKIELESKHNELTSKKNSIKRDSNFFQNKDNYVFYNDFNRDNN
jgi:hypothetical protein